MAEILLRATGGCVAVIKIPASAGDNTDAGQLGINIPSFQEVPLSPANFRRTRPVTQERQSVKYELLVSALAVQQQIGVLQLNSAEALFRIVAGVSVAGLDLLIEEWSCVINLGQPVLYRLLLRSAEPPSLVPQS